MSEGVSVGTVDGCRSGDGGHVCFVAVEDQQRDYGDRVELITGPGLGPEGSLEGRARANGVDLRTVGGIVRLLSEKRLERARVRDQHFDQLLRFLGRRGEGDGCRRAGAC